MMRVWGVVVMFCVLAACDRRHPTATPQAAAPASIDCSALFRFDSKTTLSIEEYFALADPSPQAGGEGRLVFRPVDYDQSIERDGWIAMGVVYARASSAFPPIGGVIWARGDVGRLSDGGGRIARDGGRLTLAVSVDGFSTQSGFATCKSPYVVTLDDGGVLRAADVEVGRLPQE